MAKILVIDDDVEFANLVKKRLQLEHHDAQAVYNPIEALDYLRAAHYDMLLLDWTMPQMTGLELCKQYRAMGGTAVVMMLTALSASDSKILGLDAGADDYLTKPFEMDEMLARVRALLRRGSFLQSEVLKAGTIELNTQSRVVTKNGIEVHLKPQEFVVLEFFLRNPGRVVAPEALISRLWSSPSEATHDAVYTCIKRIRKKLADPELIKTVHGVGYRCDLQVQ